MTDHMLDLLSGVAQFERARIRERQQVAIEIAKARGKFATAKKLSDDQIAEARQRIDRDTSKAEIARDLGVSSHTLCTALKTA